MAGPLQALHDKQIEIKRAVPRDQMQQPRGMMMMRPPSCSPYGSYQAGGRPMDAAPYGQAASYPVQGQYGQPAYGAPPYRGGGGVHAGLGAHISSSHMGPMAGMSSGMAGGSGGGMPMGVLGGGALNSGSGMGAYAAGGGLAGGFASGIGSASLGLGNMGAPIGSIAGLSGGAAYSLAGAGAQGNFNMAALQSALPSSGLGTGDAAQPSSGAGGGGAGYAGGQGLESYPSAAGESYGTGNEGIYGSLGAQEPSGSHIDAYASGSGGDSYGVAGGLGAAAPGEARDGAYSGGGASPPIGNFNAASSGFTAAAQHPGGHAELGPDAYMSSRPFNAPLAVSGGLGTGSVPALAHQASVSNAFGGLASNQVPVSSAFSGLGANQASVSSVFSASSFTESPLAWS